MPVASVGGRGWRSRAYCFGVVLVAGAPEPAAGALLGAVLGEVDEPLPIVLLEPLGLDDEPLPIVLDPDEPLGDEPDVPLGLVEEPVVPDGLVDVEPVVPDGLDDVPLGLVARGVVVLGVAPVAGELPAAPERLSPIVRLRSYLS